MKKPNKSIFRNRNKEAVFWERNINQTWRKGRPVKVKFARNLSETVNIRFDPSTMKAVRHQAKGRGLGVTKLIRMWTMEKLHSA
mgnify:CR=1 FL=1